jgi:hypothetical protein
MKFDLDALSPEERAKLVNEGLDLWKKVSPITAEGFTISYRGFAPSIPRRDMARILNLVLPVEDKTLVFYKIEAGTYEESDSGYDGSYVTNTWSSLTVIFKPKGYSPW